MIKKISIIFISIVILFVCTFFGIKIYSKHLIGYTKVYVASHQIKQRSLLSEEDLFEVEVPKDYLSDDVFLEKEDIIGKYVKLSYSIPKGSLFYKSCLEDDIGDLANTLLKKNEVNYDLFVSDMKINTSNIGVNMYLDLYLTINNNNEVISDLLLANCRITGLYDSNNKAIKDYDEDARVYIISIAVKQSDVNILNKAQVIGTISSTIKANTYNNGSSTVLNKDSLVYPYLL